jgi:hypothetical protein
MIFNKTYHDDDQWLEGVQGKLIDEVAEKSPQQQLKVTRQW